jgi:hypothetical protein
MQRQTNQENDKDEYNADHEISHWTKEVLAIITGPSTGG